MKLLTLEDYQKAGEHFWPKFFYVYKELGEEAKIEDVLKVMESLGAVALKLKLEDKEIKYIDKHMSTHDEGGNEIEDASHRLNLEAESLRNKAMLHILQQGVPVDKNGEKVYLQDVYNQEEEIREEE